MKRPSVSKLVALLLPIISAACANFEATFPTKGAVVVESPAVAVNSPADGAVVSDSTITVNGECTTDAGLVTISGNAITVDVTATCASDAFSANVTIAPSAGTKTLTVSQSTAAGTTTKTVSISYTGGCPTNYVAVPANATLGTPAICISQFEMKVKTNAGAPVFDGYNGGVALDVSQYMPDARPDGVPWVRITKANAILECASLGAGFHLVTTREWNAMARNVESVPANWETGIVGTGRMFTGHSDGAVSGTAIADGFSSSGTMLLAAGNGLDPYAGTGNAATDTFGAGKEQRRTFDLTNGSKIWDIAGNARDFNDVDGLGSTIAYTGLASSRYVDPFSSDFMTFVATITMSGGGAFNANWLQPATAGLTHTTNLSGQSYVSSNARTGRIITRGANFGASNFPGVFAADFDTDNATTSGSAGFRCAKNL